MTESEAQVIAVVIAEMNSRIDALKAAAPKAVTDRNRHSIEGMAATVTKWRDLLAPLRAAPASGWPCGCDPAHGTKCEAHRDFLPLSAESRE